VQGIHFDQISVKNSVLGVLYPNHCTNGVKFGAEEGTKGPLLRAKFHPNRCKKPQNRPLSNLNTDALCFVQCCR